MQKIDRVKNLTRGHPDTCTDGCKSLMDTWPHFTDLPKINENIPKNFDRKNLEIFKIFI